MLLVPSHGMLVRGAKIAVLLLLYCCLHNVTRNVIMCNGEFKMLDFTQNILRLLDLAQDCSESVVLNL